MVQGLLKVQPSDLGSKRPAASALCLAVLPPWARLGVALDAPDAQARTVDGLRQRSIAQRSPTSQSADARDPRHGSDRPCGGDRRWRVGPTTGAAYSRARLRQASPRARARRVVDRDRSAQAGARAWQA
jgi:hypothetical protein